MYVVEDGARTAPKTKFMSLAVAAPANIARNEAIVWVRVAWNASMGLWGILNGLLSIKRVMEVGSDGALDIEVGVTAIGCGWSSCGVGVAALVWFPLRTFGVLVVSGRRR